MGIAILNLVIVPLLAVFGLLPPFLEAFVLDNDNNVGPPSELLAVVEDSPCKSCEDEFGSCDRCQTSDFAIVVDGAETSQKSEKVNVE